MLTLETCTTLLEQLNDLEDAAWTGFVNHYQPVLLAIARRRGLRDDRADDAVQATLTTFFETYRGGRFNREKGGLKNWLLGIARNKFREALRAVANSPAQFPETSATTGFAGRIPESETWSDTIEEEEWERGVFAECLSRVREEVDRNTFEAFRFYGIEGLPASQVAERLGTTVNAVYIAKHRVLTRLRELAKEYE